MVKFILNALLRQIYGHMKVYYTVRKVIKNINTVSGDALENSLVWFLPPQVRQLAGLVSPTTSKTTKLSKIKVARVQRANTSQV